MKPIYFLFLFCFPVYADCTAEQVLQIIRPKAEWSLNNGEFSSLKWTDPMQTQPTQDEFDQGIIDCKQYVIDRNEAKKKAVLDVKNEILTQDERFKALLVILDLDK